MKMLSRGGVENIKLIWNEINPKLFVSCVKDVRNRVVVGDIIRLLHNEYGIPLFIEVKDNGTPLVTYKGWLKIIHTNQYQNKIKYSGDSWYRLLDIVGMYYPEDNWVKQHPIKVYVCAWDLYQYIRRYQLVIGDTYKYRGMHYEYKDLLRAWREEALILNVYDPVERGGDMSSGGGGDISAPPRPSP